MVMLNQYENGACFHLDPDRPDHNMMAAEKRLSRLVWIKFKKTFDTSDVSAETIAQLFADFGDF